MANVTEKLVWKKSTYSTGNGGACVEVAVTNASIKVRDSKDKSGPMLSFSKDSWSAFVKEAKKGKFDLKS